MSAEWLIQTMEKDWTKESFERLVTEEVKEIE